MKNKVNEWQELSLKKDIEKILKFLSKKQTIDFSIVTDLAIAVTALLLDNLLSPSSPDRTWLFWVLFIPCAALFLWHAGLFLRDIVIKNNTKYQVFSPQALMDTFDNDICYYVMMADTYDQMLQDAIKDKKNNVALFYFIETWYYINKAKAKLSTMQYKIKQIFTSCDSEVVEKNKILVSRLQNIVLIMEEIREKSNQNIKDGKLAIGDSSIISMNKKYDQHFKGFVDAVNLVFPSILSVDFDDEKRFEIMAKTP